MSGVIEDLDVLLKDFLEKIGKAEKEYLDAGGGGDPDERLERIVYGRFLEPKPAKPSLRRTKKSKPFGNFIALCRAPRSH